MHAVNQKIPSDSPVLTVVTAVYNLVKNGRGKMFDECVRSVREQTISDRIEHIIIDGASDDGTLDLIRTYEERGWVVCYSEQDKGIYDAMNKGIAKARGKYVAFVNSDDFWHEPRAAEFSIRLLEETDAAFSYSDCTVMKEDGVCRDKTAAIGVFYASMPFCHQTMIAKTEVLRRYKGFDSDYPISADWNLLLELLLGGEKPVYVPMNFTTFREGGYALTRKEQHEKDKRRVAVQHYGWLLGEEAAAKIPEGYVPSALMSYLQTKVHPSLLPDIWKEVDKVSPCLLRIRRFFPQAFTVDRNAHKGLANSVTEKLYLFHFIPLISCKRKANKRLIRLAFLLLLTCEAKKGKTYYKLFGIIPIAKKQISIS